MWVLSVALSMHSVLADAIATNGKFFYVDFWRISEGLHEVSLTHNVRSTTKEEDLVDFWMMLCTDVPITAMFEKQCMASKSCLGVPHGYDPGKGSAKSIEQTGSYNLRLFNWAEDGLRNVNVSGKYYNSDKFALTFVRNQNYWLTINSTETLAVNSMSPTFN